MSAFSGKLLFFFVRNRENTEFALCLVILMAEVKLHFDLEPKCRSAIAELRCASEIKKLKCGSLTQRKKIFSMPPGQSNLVTKI